MKNAKSFNKGENSGLQQRDKFFSSFFLDFPLDWHSEQKSESDKSVDDKSSFLCGCVGAFTKFHISMTDWHWNTTS